MTKPVTWSPSAETALARLHGRLFANVTETAAILHYDHRTVRAGCASGQIPAVKIGSCWRVPVAWLRKQAEIDAA